MSGLLYVFKPNVIDLPPDQNPDALAWFAQFSSGHFRHADSQLVDYATQNQIPFVTRNIGWGEYQRIYKESHWYE